MSVVGWEVRNTGHSASNDRVLRLFLSTLIFPFITQTYPDIYRLLSSRGFPSYATSMKVISPDFETREKLKCEIFVARLRILVPVQFLLLATPALLETGEQ